MLIASLSLLVMATLSAPDPPVDLAIRKLASTFASSKLTGGLHVQWRAMASVCADLNLNTAACSQSL